MTSGGRIERQSSDSLVQLSSGYRFKPIPASSVHDSNGVCAVHTSSNLPPNIANWPLRRQMFLLLSMTGLKPVGCLRHWRVLAICERMRHLMKGGGDEEQEAEGSGIDESEQDITPEEVWAFFHLLYNVNKVEAHISDNLPFQCKENEVREFALPETADFSRLLYEKVNAIKEQSAAAALNAKSENELSTTSTSAGTSNRNRSSGSNATPRSSTSSSKGDDGAFVVEPSLGSSSSSSSPTLSSATVSQKRTHDSISSTAAASNVSGSAGGFLGSSSRAALSDAKTESPRSKLRRR
ncbi:uncharacterized protein LOC142337331 [Convolutriloba macropyga]|uniref:uncharacterized protein LOC142337331 n=1 Tax=Convolutriloba macropyga TaxID=536237 RepID=UPI003F525D96